MSLPHYQPMLAIRWPEPFSDPEWTFELKFDGVRTLLYWDGERVVLRSRRDRDVSSAYPELQGFRAGAPCVLDGEVIALDDDNRPSFQRLQARMNLARPGNELVRMVPVTYVAFDLLFLGADMTGRPIEERRAALDEIEPAAPVVRSDVVAGDGLAMWEFVADRKLEGMVAKRAGSTYRSGARSSDWRKVSRVQAARVVIGGFTPGEGGRSTTFGSLLAGLWTDAGLRWCGSVGTGFDDAALRRIRAALDEMIRAEMPFLPDPEIPAGSVWVEPQLVALVEFKEWTSAGRFRAPSFLGFTDDDPAEATWQSEGP